MEKLSKKCLICDSAKLKYYLKKNNFQIYKCKECEAEYVNPLPDDKTLTQVYNNPKYHSEERYDISQNNKKIRSSWQKRLKQIASLGYHQCSLLDVGCATGIFLKNAQDEGWQVEGIEISKSAAGEAANLLGNKKVKSVDFIEYTSAHLFDVVTFWALIEHITDPVSYLMKINSILKSKGLIAFSTPNVHSISRRIFKENWRYYIPPEHLFYFEKKSLVKLLENSGFSIIKIKTHFQHIAYFRRDSNILVLYQKYLILRIFFKILYLPLAFLCEKYDLGETMEVYAIKT